MSRNPAFLPVISGAKAESRRSHSYQIRWASYMAHDNDVVPWLKTVICPRMTCGVQIYDRGSIFKIQDYGIKVPAAMVDHQTFVARRGIREMHAIT
jgi:hypothetical protein